MATKSVQTSHQMYYRVNFELDPPSPKENLKDSLLWIHRDTRPLGKEDGAVTAYVLDIIRP